MGTAEGLARSQTSTTTFTHENQKIGGGLGRAVITFYQLLPINEFSLMESLGESLNFAQSKPQTQSHGLTAGFPRIPWFLPQWGTILIFVAVFWKISPRPKKFAKKEKVGR